MTRPEKVKQFLEAVSLASASLALIAGTFAYVWFHDHPERPSSAKVILTDAPPLVPYDMHFPPP